MTDENKLVDEVEVEETDEKQSSKETETKATEEKAEKEEKTFTQEEVNRIISERLAKEKEKTEEAKKLAQMNADEKAAYELKKSQDELAKREAEINKRELTAEAKDMLAERGLSIDLHTLVDYTDAESVLTSVKSLEAAIQVATEKAVADRLKGTTPKKGTAPKVSSPWDEVMKKYKK